MTVLERMGEWVSTESPLPPEVLQQLAIHLLDSTGAWIAGRATEEGAMLARFSGEQRTDRVVLGAGAVKLTEVDDFHMASCTAPGSIVVPAALTTVAGAYSVRKQWPRAKTLAHALHVGYETVTRFGAAVSGSKILFRGIWPTFLAAPLGAAAVTARILCLDARRATHALGIALTLTSGSPGGHARVSARWLLLGLATRSGCAAAFAAGDGFEVDRTLLDQDWMARTHGIDCDPDALRAGPQGTGVMAELSLKPYCAAKQCVAVIDAFRDLLAQGISPAEAVHVRIGVPPLYAGMIGHRNAAGARVGRITSAAYHLALAAYRPDELNDVKRPNLTDDAGIATFMERVEVVPDEDLAVYYPRRWPARVEVVLKDGRTVSKVVLDATGDPGHPARFPVQEKFHRLADPVIGKSAAVEVEQSCLKALESDEAVASLCTTLQRLDLI